ncbi:MAG: helix-turn-helix domain-containing protein [Candidatus Sericytochromatia bacterium]|nr:helix-turn-helix domain-containing protein [Candidatus Tanganyikabacteria bacterium]
MGTTPLGERLCALRTGRGLSLAQLARLSGLSKGHVSNVEKGRVQATARVIERLAPHLGVPAGSLLEQAMAERKDRVERRFLAPREPGLVTLTELSEEERIILGWLRSLAPGQRQALAELAGRGFPLGPERRKASSR